MSSSSCNNDTIHSHLRWSIKTVETGQKENKGIIKTYDGSKSDRLTFPARSVFCEVYSEKPVKRLVMQGRKQRCHHNKVVINSYCKGFVPRHHMIFTLASHRPLNTKYAPDVSEYVACILGCDIR